ncbi:MAG: hypothetical protein ACLUDH_08065 [Faecalispora sporosphaeroides]|uniref:Uncharacterized protein n=1 Tax=Faecalispora sporosphaeroides TaxID=1549 RepID=A0A928Q2T4_9FIRM|nr:hypothetical protein [Faecalispora sporosphaeroides]MBE6833278.1 hypothetical protein [Faecalispora sporosphaeroides]
MNTLSVFTFQFSFRAISVPILSRGSLQSQAKERPLARYAQNSDAAANHFLKKEETVLYPRFCRLFPRGVFYRIGMFRIYRPYVFELLADNKNGGEKKARARMKNSESSRITALEACEFRGRIGW